MSTPSVGQPLVGISVADLNRQAGDTTKTSFAKTTYKAEDISKKCFQYGSVTASAFRKVRSLKGRVKTGVAGVGVGLSLVILVVADILKGLGACIANAAIRGSDYFRRRSIRKLAGQASDARCIQLAAHRKQNETTVAGATNESLGSNKRFEKALNSKAQDIASKIAHLPAEDVAAATNKQLSLIMEDPSIKALAEEDKLEAFENALKLAVLNAVAAERAKDIRDSIFNAKRPEDLDTFVTNFARALGVPPTEIKGIFLGQLSTLLVSPEAIRANLEAKLPALEQTILAESAGVFTDNMKALVKVLEEIKALQGERNKIDTGKLDAIALNSAKAALSNHEKRNIALIDIAHGTGRKATEEVMRAEALDRKIIDLKNQALALVTRLCKINAERAGSKAKATEQLNRVVDIVNAYYPGTNMGKLVSPASFVTEDIYDTNNLVDMLKNADQSGSFDIQSIIQNINCAKILPPISRETVSPTTTDGSASTDTSGPSFAEEIAAELEARERESNGGLNRQYSSDSDSSGTVDGSGTDSENEEVDNTGFSAAENFLKATDSQLTRFRGQVV